MVYLYEYLPSIERITAASKDGQEKMTSAEHFIDK